MSNLNSCFPAVTGAAKTLQIAQNVGQFGVRSDRLDVVHLKAAVLTTLDALPTIAIKRLHP